MRECRGERHIGNPETLRAQTAPWLTSLNLRQRGVGWWIMIGDATRKLKSVDPRIFL
jgi:hypothetical protein